MNGLRSAKVLIVCALLVVYFYMVVQVYHLQKLAAQLEGADMVQQDGHNSKISNVVTDPESIVVIYNRIPKTGSTSFIGLAYDLCSKNGFSVIHINTTKNSRTLSLSDQMRFVTNITNWIEKKPVIYHGHIAFLNFDRFGVSQKPLFINVIRRPLDRFVSNYYFVRYGDDFRPYLVRRKQGDKMTLDECVSYGHSDCSPELHMWVQIPFFCGHYADCWTPGSTWALEQAKHNLLHHYFLVGIMEEMREFVALLEYSVPRLFRGALELYEIGPKSHLRKTTKKILPSEETVSKLKSSKVWQLENEFYEFVLHHFTFLKKKTINEDTELLLDRGSNFQYEKIKPKVL